MVYNNYAEMVADGWQAPNADYVLGTASGALVRQGGKVTAGSLVYPVERALEEECAYFKDHRQETVPKSASDYQIADFERRAKELPRPKRTRKWYEPDGFTEGLKGAIWQTILTREDL